MHPSKGRYVNVFYTLSRFQKIQLLLSIFSPSDHCGPSVRGCQMRRQSQDKLMNKYFITQTRYFWTGRYCDIHCWQNWSNNVIVMLSSIKDSLKMFSSGPWTCESGWSKYINVMYMYKSIQFTLCAFYRQFSIWYNIHICSELLL